LVKVSPRGQVVIPKDLRDLLGLKGGDRLVARAEGDVIVLKKVDIPELQKGWERIFKKGELLAKEKGIDEVDVEKIIHRRRGVKA
jgi:AbrB family looped-hinge helix DNA binding protein